MTDRIGDRAVQVLPPGEPARIASVDVEDWFHTNYASPVDPTKLPSRVEAAVEVGVHAVGRRQIEALEDLVLPPGAPLEGGEAAPDAVLDRMIQTDVEVQKGVFLEAPPVAAIEAIAAYQM